ncbi:MAG: ABC transporter ATP-binding protein [Candidatus Bipolaricaulia bacterium]
MADVLLKAEALCKYFYRGDGWWGRRNHTKIIQAVDHNDLKVNRGETLALVGESGSGKTTLGKTLIRIYKPTKGKIWFEGQEISSVDGNELRNLRKHMQMVFQDTASSLNPRRTIFDAISLPLKIHERLTRAQIRHRVEELLEAVDLPQEFMYRYPHTLSGGQKQRVGIARALATNPKLIILDEPSSALDVSVQAKILELLMELQKRFQLTYIYISHDLSVVRNIADRTAVMYLGRIVEIAPTDKLFQNPLHPYTRALLSAIPVVSKDEQELIPEEITLEGEIPSPVDVPPVCVFLSRCPKKLPVCDREVTPMIQVEEGHYVRCHLY